MQCEVEDDEIRDKVGRKRIQVQEILQDFAYAFKEYKELTVSQECSSLKKEQFKEEVKRAEATSVQLGLTVKDVRNREEKMMEEKQKALDDANKTCMALEQSGTKEKESLAKEKLIWECATNFCIQETEQESIELAAEIAMLQPKVDELKEKLKECKDAHLEKELDENDEVLESWKAEKEHADHMNAMATILLTKLSPTFQPGKTYPEAVKEKARELYVVKRAVNRTSGNANNALAMQNDAMKQLGEKVISLQEELSKQKATQHVQEQRRLQMAKRLEELEQRQPDTESRSTASEDEDSRRAFRPVGKVTPKSP